LATGYKPPGWDAMITDMHLDFMKEDCYANNAYRKAIEAGLG
jgi:hypothetical protein